MPQLAFDRSLAAIVAVMLLGIAPSVAEEPFPLDVMLEEVQAALVRVNDLTAEDELPRLKSVELSLQTSIAKDASGRFAFFVISLGGQTAETSVQSLTVVLSPPPPGTSAPVGRADLAETLAEAIVAAARGLKPALKRDPPLALEQLVAELRFAVDTSGSAGIKAELVPITVDVGAKISSTQIQTIKVTFAEK